MKINVTISSIILATSILLAGCLPANTAADVGAGLNVAVCVLDHSTEPVSQIVTDCAGASVELVTTILSAHRTAMAREASLKATYPDAGK